MHHGFDVELAKKYGIAPAILLEYLGYWVVYNSSLNQNRVDGKFWTYNSLQAMQEQFPYLNERQLKYAFQKLREHKLILVRKLSIDKMDKTNWYTLTDKGLRECNVVFCDGTILSDATDKNAPIDGTKVDFGKQNCPLDGTNLSDDKDLLHYNITNSTLHTNPPLSPQGKNPAGKVEYGSYVHMKVSEHKTLVDKYGEQTTKELIEILDNYKGSTGKTYKDDYRAILSWVINRWREDHTERNSKSFKRQDEEHFLNTIKELDDLYGD